MNFLRQLAGLFRGGRGGGGRRYLTIYVLSRRCREPLSGQVDLFNEVSAIQEGDAAGEKEGDDRAFFTRKVLHTTGERRCFEQVEVNLYFDRNKNLAHHEVVGGTWLTQAEYESELIRFNAAPDEAGDEPPSPSD